MRHYREGTKIYIFGFSRGAYTARFLNEMLDFVGLLGPDNEEVIPFIWDAFASWKLGRTNDNGKAKHRAYCVMKASREVLSRPMPRVHFLGMFDAVNSVADFEVNVDAMPATKIIRHAVSIDERRIKFRPVLLRAHQEERSNHTHYHNSKGDYPGPKSQAEAKTSSGPPVLPEVPNVSIPDRNADVETDTVEQVDVEEMWFPGGHADIGGGWNYEDGESWQLSHAPLVWMVQEAQKAGLQFDACQMKKFECIEEYDRDETPIHEGEKKEASGEISPSRRSFLHALYCSGNKGRIHDLLDYGNGLPITSVLSWRLMEYLPLRRMEVQPDGKWKAVRWPPPRGQARDIPADAQIHVSAIQRMKSDASYRPPALTYGLSEGDIDGSGIGKWIVHSHEGDRVRERYVRDISR